MDIETLLATEEIRGLRRDFSWYLDTSNPDALADLFWSDGVIDTGPWGRMEGQDAIRAGYGRSYKGMPKFTALHSVTNPRIVVNGDRAEGSWYLLDYSLREANVNPLTIVALYEEEFAKRDGVWKYTFMRLNYLWSAEQGRITAESPLKIPESARRAHRAGAAQRTIDQQA